MHTGSVVNKKVSAADSIIDEVTHPLLEDEREVVAIYRRAKKMGYADIAITIQGSIRVKIWLTEKMK
ncbi:MAG TPA: hypothetical protein VJH70_02625 [Candidatus Paceibacterota bacterium]